MQAGELVAMPGKASPMMKRNANPVFPAGGGALALPGTYTEDVAKGHESIHYWIDLAHAIAYEVWVRVNWSKLEQKGLDPNTNKKINKRRAGFLKSYSMNGPKGLVALAKEVERITTGNIAGMNAFTGKGGGGGDTIININVERPKGVEPQTITVPPEPPMTEIAVDDRR